GGGSDLPFPQHACSAARAERSSGAAPLASHCVHAGMVGLKGATTGKAKGNVVCACRLRNDGVDPMARRLARMAVHYRADRQWTAELCKQGVQRLGRWRAAVGAPAGPPAAPLLAGVGARIAGDLDTPGALAVVDEWVDATLAGGGSDPDAPRLVRDTVDALLGVAL